MEEQDLLKRDKSFKDRLYATVESAERMYETHEPEIKKFYSKDDWVRDYVEAFIRERKV